MTCAARCIPAAIALWCASQAPAIAQPAPGAPAGRDGQAVLVAPPLPQAVSGKSGEVFRSVDENGTPTFSQTRPPGRASAPVELRPLAGTIDSLKPSPATARAGVQPRPDAALSEPRVERPSAAAPAVRGMAFETFIRIRRGMTEGELLGRAGPPDHRGNEINRGLLQESWYYLPTPSDPFTTVIQMRGGRVVDTDRIRRL